MPPLTLRQKQISELVCKGHSNQEIADKLNVTLATVKHHLTIMYTKKRVNSRAQYIVQQLEARK